MVKLVSEGLGNKEVAARLFVSPRTVQAHLTHIYTKLGPDLARAARPGGSQARLNSARIRAPCAYRLCERLSILDLLWVQRG